VGITLEVDIVRIFLGVEFVGIKFGVDVVGIILGEVVVGITLGEDVVGDIGEVGRLASVAVFGVARQKKQDFCNAAVATLITKQLSF